MNNSSHGDRLLEAFSNIETLDSGKEVWRTDSINALYIFMGRYNLSQQKDALVNSLTSWIGDLFWSIRISRNFGLRKGAAAYLAMRDLRKMPFDRAFYRLQIENTTRSRMDPIRHYVVFGAAEGLDPAPGFSTLFYYRAHEDVKNMGANPFSHYLKHGRRENRRIEPSDKLSIFLNACLVNSQITDNPFDISSTLPEQLLHLPLDESGHYSWPLRDSKIAPQTIFDFRPDDGVINEAEKGRNFLDKFQLLSLKPDFKNATIDINKIPAVSKSQNKPYVSIIIPIYNQLAYTLNCIHALLSHNSKYNYEVIIGDDCSTDESEYYLNQIDKIKYFKNNKNIGFVGNCNETAKKAMGQYIVLLNNDTRVCEGWLDALIDTFDLFPYAGMTGSKLFYPDGTLQEAGGIVWQDGSAWNYGRNDDPNRPRYCHARLVDYISGASIAVRADIWNELGGFDEAFKPAYYEDTDLAFQIRTLGKQVIMQPLSRIIHYEGKTSGTDLGKGIKSYQTVNAKKFFDKWATTLNTHSPNGTVPWLERERGKNMRVLIIDATTPTEGTDAGSTATINLISQYQSLGFKVIFVPEDNFLYQPDATSKLQGMGVECLYAPYDIPMSVLLHRYGDLFDVVQFIRPNVAEKNIDLVCRYSPNAKRLYLNADLHYLRMLRQSEIEQDDDLREQAYEMKTREISLSKRVNVNLVHSLVEKDIIEREASIDNVIYYPLIEPEIHSSANPTVSTRRDFMFLGGYRHKPNIDAVEWLLKEIWPDLAKAFPEACLLIVGADPPESILCHASDRIIVTGKVTDLAPWFHRTRVFLAALRYGAGAKGKVLASLAHGVPVLATDIAAEGMPFEKGRHITIANTKTDYLSEALRLYKLKPKAWKKLSLEGQTYIKEGHTFNAGLNALRSALTQAGLFVSTDGK